MTSAANEDRARLSTILIDMGLAPVEQGANALRITMDGIHATAVVDGDGTLSLLCSVRGDGLPWDLRAVNAANNRIRFAKFSVDRTNLLLEADFVLRLASRDAKEELQQIIKLWRMALRELRLLVEELAPA